MGIKAELFALIERLAGQVRLPPIRQVYLPEPNPGPDRHTEFGVIELADGSAGLYYAWLGDAQRRMDSRFPLATLLERDPIDTARLFLSEDQAECSLGLAVINAISQSIMRRAAYVPVPAPDSIGALDLDADDHLGMVGYFPPLVERLGRRGIRMTVIEKKAGLGEGDTGITLTRDPGQLRHCNKILTTATVMLNDTVDEILACSADAEVVVMVGPSAGFLPDPLFNHGVTALGGSEILNANCAIQRLRNNQGLGDAARKYLIRADGYPGLDKLQYRDGP